MSLDRTRHPGIFRRGESYVAIVAYRDGFGRKRQKWLSEPSLQRVRDARRTLLNELEKGSSPTARG